MKKALSIILGIVVFMLILILAGCGGVTHTITASAGAGGGIAPSGAVVVNDGSSQTFAITANSGYSISSVMVDGLSAGAVVSYTFTNVTANHTISANFAAAPPPPSGVYNVRDYGAKGDGTTNDTQAIRAAIAATPRGGTIYMPSGTYIVKAPSSVTPSILPLLVQNLKVVGDGIGNTVIKVADNSPTYITVMGSTGANLSGLEAYGITFDHNIAHNPPGVVNVSGSYSLLTVDSSNVNMHDMEARNASSTLNFSTQDFTSGRTTHDNTFHNIVCSVGIGDDPTHYNHDASFIEPQGSARLFMTNCNLSCPSANLPGQKTGVEADASGETIQNNTFTNFDCGILPFNNTLVATGLVDTNTITNCKTGISLWSNSSGGGYGFNGFTVSNNTIVSPITWGSNSIIIGVEINQNSNTNANNVTITNNNISMVSQPASGSNASYTHDFGAIVLMPGTSAYTLSNSTISNNHVTNWSMNGIRTRCKLTNLTISGNVLTNCGSCASGNQYTASLLVENSVTNGLTITGNTFADTNATARQKYLVYLSTATSATGIVLSGNTYTTPYPHNGAFTKQIEVADDITVPLIQETIANFVPPTGKVNTASWVRDGTYLWTVGSDGKTWTKNPAYNVKSYGATGNGTSDDSAAIRSAITACPVNGTVYFPAGTYKVSCGGDGNAFNLGNYQNVFMDSSTVVQLDPNSTIPGSYGIFSISTGIQHVTITGGTIIGAGASGEHGACIGMWNCQHVTIDGVTCKESQGDGITIGGDHSVPQDVTVKNCICDHNRRQGISILCLYGGLIQNNHLINTYGTSPSSGIDLEPYENASGSTSDQHIENVTIDGNTCSNNGNGTTLVGMGIVGSASVTGSVVANNTITNNTCSGNYQGGIGFNKAQNLIITGNICTGNREEGITLCGCTGTTVDSNTTSSNGQIAGQSGIHLTADAWGGGTIYTSSCTVEQNTSSSNTGYGIVLDTKTSGNTVIHNTMSGNTYGNTVQNAGSGNTVTPNP